MVMVSGYGATDNGEVTQEYASLPNVRICSLASLPAHAPPCLWASGLTNVLRPATARTRTRTPETRVTDFRKWWRRKWAM